MQTLADPAHEAIAPALPPMKSPAGGEEAPAAPKNAADTGVSRATLLDLAVKVAYTVPRFTTDWACQQLALPVSVVGDLLEQLRSEHLLEVLGEAGLFGYRYAISQRGR